jgi:hypothetical protein
MNHDKSQASALLYSRTFRLCREELQSSAQGFCQTLPPDTGVPGDVDLDVEPLLIVFGDRS